MDFVPPQNDFYISPREALITAANRKVLTYIETTFNKILHEIQIRPCGKPVIVLRRIVSVRPYHDANDFNRLKWHIQDREVSYSFPAKTRDEAWRFGERSASLSSQILMVPSMPRADSGCDIFSNQGRSHSHQEVPASQSDADKSLTQTRDLYYQDPTLFKQQETVDRYIDDIAHTCQVTRSDLNVVS